MPILLLNKETDEWDTITEEQKNQLPPEIKAETLTIAGALKDKLDFGLKERAKNNDVLGIVDGKEGTGKSSLAGEIMRYVTKDKFDPKKDMIGADYDDALEKIDNVKHGGFLMFDEGNAFFMSTDTTKKESRELHKIFSIFRQLNLFVIICLPSFMRMNSYFAHDRPKFLCSTYIKKGERGRFAYYGEQRLGKFYNLGRKMGYNRGVVKPEFRRKFNACIRLENTEYQSFKLKTLKEAITKARNNTKENRPKKPQEIKNEFIDEFISKHPDKKSPELGKLLGLHESTIRLRRKKMRKKDKSRQNDENNS